jgi:hypothetical protein
MYIQVNKLPCQVGISQKLMLDYELFHPEPIQPTTSIMSRHSLTSQQYQTAYSHEYVHKHEELQTSYAHQFCPVTCNPKKCLKTYQHRTYTLPRTPLPHECFRPLCMQVHNRSSVAYRDLESGDGSVSIGPIVYPTAQLHLLSALNPKINQSYRLLPSSAPAGPQPLSKKHHHQRLALKRMELMYLTREVCFPVPEMHRDTLVVTSVYLGYD